MAPHQILSLHFPIDQCPSPFLSWCLKWHVARQIGYEILEKKKDTDK